MKKTVNSTFKKITALLLTLIMLIGLLPLGFGEFLLTAVAEIGAYELNDGYLSVKVSKSNGGFLVDTVEGDKLNKSDNNKFLLYPDKHYDTSFTSFRVTRGDKTEEYVFGRDYSYKGIETGDVTVTQTDENSISAVWTVDSIEFTQQVTLLNMANNQHGMVYITCMAVNKSAKPVDEIKARILLDTALGYQDYAVYMAGQSDGSYTTIKTEQTVLGNAYSNYFFAYDDEVAPSVTAYTVNATIGGVTVLPEKATFAHWNSLASSVFDYEPGEDPTQTLNFTNPYNKEYLTADSAVAMYYDMGTASAGSQSTKPIGLYYGVYSNATAEEGSVAVNFIAPSAMELVGNKGYKDLNGEEKGNMTLTVKVQNTSEKEIDTLAIAFYPGSDIISYDSEGNENLTATAADPYYTFLTDLNPGETRDVNVNLAVSPTDVTDYRKINVKVFDVTEKMASGKELHLMDEDLVLSKEAYVLCPSMDGGVLSFTSTTPEIVYYTGTRNVFIAGKNFNLLRDKTQYRLLLRPLNGGADVEVPSDNVIVNTEDNTANLILDRTLTAGTWQVIIDWVDAAATDTTSDVLRFVVTTDPLYAGGSYGVLAVKRNEKNGNYTYDLLYCRDEADYEKKTANVKTEDIIYEIRGDFSLSVTDDGKLDKLEAVARKDGDAINISNCIEVTEGRVTVSLKYDGNGKQAAINTDIDGTVYTVGSNTKVWDGVCAITSIKNGKLYKLPKYKYDGTESTFVEDQVANTDFVSLIWPGAASSMQTLAGMLLELRYCYFGFMAKEPGSTAPDVRIVNFGAQLDAGFLVPSNIKLDEMETSAIDAVQLKLAKGNYTAEQLREVEETYARDRKRMLKAQGATLALYAHNIFFGGGGFIGINTSIEVGLPSYTDGMPSIEGDLDLKIINDEWALGIEGRADLAVLSMEAEFRLRSYNGIPVPDKVRFHIGGTFPGIPVDTFGIFWVRGAGAGIDKLYETYFVSSSIPPLTLMLSGEFAIFNVLSTRADVSLSARGISAELSDLAVAGITIIDSLSGSVYWYPRLDIKTRMMLDILDIVKGSGHIAVQEVPEENGKEAYTFWEGFATASVKLPDFLGGLKVAEAKLGVNTDMLWGAIQVIKLDAGVTYHWGGDVDFALGKYNAPEPVIATMSLRSTPVYTAEDGRTLYARAFTNSRLLAATIDVNLDETEITSSADKLTHRFALATGSDEDGMLIISVPAENASAAENIKKKLSLTVGGETYEINWFDNTKPADDPANADANAIFNYDSESGYVSITLSLTEDECFGSLIELKTPVASEVAVYGIERLGEISSVELSRDQRTASVTGNSINKLSEVSIFAIDENGTAILIGKAEGTGYDSIDITFPGNMPSGTYTLKAVGTEYDENGNAVSSPSAESEFEYENPNQPDAVRDIDITTGGDYTIDVEIDKVKNAEGYYTNIYELDENGTLSATMFKDMKTEGTEFTVGGSYEAYVDGSEETKTVGLEAGKKYVVGVRAYITASDGSILLSKEKQSSPLTMVEPVKNEVVLKAENAVAVSAGYGETTVDTVASSEPVITVGGIDKGKGSYTLNGGEPIEWKGGNISLSELEDGIYTISLHGENATKDSFGTVYQFAVDTKAPSVMIESPLNGSFFEGESVTVTGITESGANVTVALGDKNVTAIADEQGAFTAEIAVDDNMAYQEISVKAEDAVGNASEAISLTLANRALGAVDAKAVLVCGDEVITELTAGIDTKVEMALQADGKLIKLNQGAMGSMVDYMVDVREGAAEINGDGTLTSSADVCGIVVATLGTYQAAAVFTSNSLTRAVVELDIPEGGYVYDGTPKTPDVLSVSLNGITLDSDDYTVVYSNNTVAGVASVIIVPTAESGYTDSATVTFNIAKNEFDTITLEVTAPMEGQTPQTTLNLPDGCAEATIEWKFGEEAFDGVFVADNIYTAVVTLKPAENSSFSENISAEGWTVTTNEDGSVTMTRDYTVAKTEHTHEPGEPVTENEVKATCMSGGTYDKVVYCGLCGKELSREAVTTPVGDHSFTDYVSNGDSTCAADGTMTAECIYACGTKDTVADEGSALEHIDEDGDRICDDCGGEVDDYCILCGDKKHTDPITRIFCIVMTIIEIITVLVQTINYLT